jgi:sec-independent protein translocase protein TatA
MFGLGPMELVVILLIILVLFGAKRLPDLASGIGKSIKNFKEASKDDTPKDKDKDKE